MIDSSDARTADLFGIKSEVIEDSRVAVCRLVSDITDGTDRAIVARRMTDILGRSVSKSMIDAWASTKREAHNLPAYAVFALEAAQDRHDITNFQVAQHAGKAFYGYDATQAMLDAEQAELDAARQQIAKRLRNIRQLQQRLRGGQ